jgi:2-methylcitrate dehydratase PrpD
VSAAAQQSLTQSLAAGVAAIRFEDLRADVVEVAHHGVLDWLGVGLAGASEPVTEHAFAIASDGRITTDGSRLLRRSERLPAPDAALVNATAAHALDYDDSQLEMEGHASTPILSAIVALGERHHCSGRALIAGYAAGVELAASIGTLLNPQHYEIGWHATATIGTVAAAGACANLLGLDDATTATSLSIACAQTAGLKTHFGTMTKPFQVGKASSNGLASTLLAARGMTARGEILDSVGGLVDMYTVKGGLAEPRPISPDGTALLSTLFKFHAACHFTHPGIDALRRLRAAHLIEIADIEHVEVFMAPSLDRVCNIHDPRTGLETKFSLRGTASLALLDHDTTAPSTYVDVTAQSAAFREVMKRVSVTPIESLDYWQTRVVVSTRDGRKLQEEVDLGHPASNLTEQWQRLGEKFHRLAEYAGHGAQAWELHDRVTRLTELDDVGQLLAGTDR